VLPQRHVPCVTGDFIPTLSVMDINRRDMLALIGATATATLSGCVADSVFENDLDFLDVGDLRGWVAFDDAYCAHKYLAS